MEQKPIPFHERIPFLMGITLLGGFLDAYTYMTRDGAFCTMHTGNMAKLGIFLAQANWSKALSFFIPIMACMLGSFTSEAIKTHTPAGKDWRKTALAAEVVALCAVAFLPVGFASTAVVTLFSYLSGIYMCIFRTSPWGAHNTTFCTGNIRSMGQYLYAALHDRTEASRSRFLWHLCVIFSFSLGAGIGVPICRLLGGPASLFGAAVAAILLISMILNDKKTH